MKLSRTQLADFLIAEQGSKAAVRRVASYLISEGRIKELDVLLRQVEAQLAKHGHVVAHVTTARQLSDEQKKQAVTMVRTMHSHTTNVEVIDTIDPSLLGGMVIQTPNMEVDVSVRAKLNRLTQAPTTNQQIRSDQ